MKISTIIAAYNAEETLATTIQSALSQRCEAHEVIVVNDGSTDSTESILENFGDRIRVIMQKNCGVAAARNTGVRHARGKYVAFLDSDDLWMPDKLSLMTGALESNPNAILAFSEYARITSSGEPCGESNLGHAPSMKELMELSLPPILTSTWVLSREAFERCGGFSQNFVGQGFEDSWMLLLLREQGEFIYLSERLTQYRIAPGDESADKYQKGLAIFTNLAQKRYGSRGKRLIRNAKNLQCRWLLTKIAHQMDTGDHTGALKSFVRILVLRPAYFVGPQFLERVIQPQNMRRFREIATVQGRSQNQDKESQL